MPFAYLVELNGTRLNGATYLDETEKFSTKKMNIDKSTNLLNY